MRDHSGQQMAAARLLLSTACRLVCVFGLGLVLLSTKAIFLSQAVGELEAQMAAELLQKQGKAERKKRQRAAREAGEEEEGEEEGPGGAKRMAAAAFDVYEGDVKMQKEEDIDEEEEEEDKLVRIRVL